MKIGSHRTPESTQDSANNVNYKKLTILNLKLTNEMIIGQSPWIQKPKRSLTTITNIQRKPNVIKWSGLDL